MPERITYANEDAKIAYETAKAVEKVVPTLGIANDRDITEFTSVTFAPEDQARGGWAIFFAGGTFLDPSEVGIEVDSTELHEKVEVDDQPEVFIISRRTSKVLDALEIPYLIQNQPVPVIFNSQE